MHYYDPNTGARVRKEGLVQDKEGRTFFINNDGSKYTGTRMIDGNLYYFEIELWCHAKRNQHRTRRWKDSSNF